MSEERKRIVVNSDNIDTLGRLVHSKPTKTRKKKDNTQTAAPTQRTLKKPVPPPTGAKISHSLLRNIRKSYQEKQSNILDNLETPAFNKSVENFKEMALDTVDNTSSEVEKKSSNNEFISSMDFLNQVVQSTSSSSPPKPLSNTTPSIISNKINYHHILKPSYGCLKSGVGGVLPTYRTLTHLTQKKLPVNATVAYINSSTVPLPPAYMPQAQAQAQAPVITQPIQQPIPIVPVSRQNKTRKVQRTFKVGRSSTKPVVAVLLQNETIRKRIMNQKHSLNLISLHQIKSELIKAGLIKIGSDAPENILRKIYENMILIGGPVKNFNPDIIAYNLLHHPEVYAN